MVQLFKEKLSDAWGLPFGNKPFVMYIKIESMTHHSTMKVISLLCKG